MTALAVGSSVTVARTDGGSIAISTNGGFGSVVVTPTVGSAVTTNFGPSPIRQVFGPYAEGASLLITNSSCNSLDYDAGQGGYDPSSVAITGGVIAGMPVQSMSSRMGILRTAQGLHNALSTGAATGHTFQQMFSCPVPFYAVQVLYANASAQDMTVLADRYKCAVAATEQVADRSGPYQGGSKVANWTGLTFGGNSYPNLPAASGFNYVYSLSDVAEVPSFAPTDGTAEYKLIARVFKNTAGIQYVTAGGLGSALRGLTGSDVYADDVGAADYTSSNPGAVATPDQGLLTTPAVVFHTAQRYATILAVGDSISGGTGTTAGVMGYPLRTKLSLAAAGKKVGVIPTGVAGSTATPGYINRAKSVISAGVQPTFCLFPIQTRNDAGGAAPSVVQTQNRISTALQFAEWLADRNIVPIIVGPTPEVSLPAAGVTAFSTFESVGPVLAAAVGGAYVSALTLLSAGVAGSYGWAAGADTSDNIHLTDQGAQKLGALTAAAIAPYL